MLLSSSAHSINRLELHLQSPHDLKFLDHFCNTTPVELQCTQCVAGSPATVVGVTSSVEVELDFNGDAFIGDAVCFPVGSSCLLTELTIARSVGRKRYKPYVEHALERRAA